MKFIGFSFNKISIEKFSDKVENLNINTKIDISDIEAVQTDFLDKKEEIINIKFNYNIDYDPDFAKINLTGNVLLSDQSKIIKNILKEWKDKKMSEDFRISLFNVILRKSNIKALQLEDEMNLPLHLPFPKLQKENKKDKEEKN